MRHHVSRLFFLYWVVVLVDLGLIYFEKTELRWFTKPLLMPLLAVAVFSSRKFIQDALLIILALLFSWAGDILLQMNGMFIAGLVAFLLAHITYILYFLRIQSSRKGLLQMQPFIGMPAVVYVFLFLYFLYPFLDALRIPVTVYALTIGLMLLAAINTRGKADAMAATLFFNGALQFIISDSVLAVNKFVYPSAIFVMAVMATYASAQYLIVKGSMTTGAGNENEK